MLNKRGYELSRVWSLTPENLDEIGVDGNSVEVRPVGLGDGVIYNVSAGNQFYFVGRSCGIRRAKNFSTEERVVTIDEKVYEQIRKMLE